MTKEILNPSGNKARRTAFVRWWAGFRELRFAVVGSMFLLLVATRADGLAPTVPRAMPESDLTAGPAVHELRIVLSQESIRALSQNPRTYVRAVLRADGQRYSEVGLHLKGATGSFRSLDDKPGLTIDLRHFAQGQKFYGITKFHLNNSVEDPSYLAALIGSEVFRSAGLHSPQVTHALVWLNDRRLGLYVMLEGFAEEFRHRSFPGDDGLLLEPEPGQDIDGRMQVRAGQIVRGSEAVATILRPLLLATQEPDLTRRWERLQSVLEVDSFITFMAVEILLGHRDGYSIAKNNFRIYVRHDTGRVVFLPQGLDQLFEPFDLSWKPHLAGLVSRALLETAEGQRCYAKRAPELFALWSSGNVLMDRTQQAGDRIRPFLRATEAADLGTEIAHLGERIARRSADLERQFSRPSLIPVDFPLGWVLLTDWIPMDLPEGGQLRREVSGEIGPALMLQAGPITFASWRSAQKLGPGHYRFEVRARTAGVKPLPFGKNQGFALRVSGDRPRSRGLLGDADWQLLTVEFAVDRAEEEIELICELRASAGKAWVDSGTLRLVKTD